MSFSTTHSNGETDYGFSSIVLPRHVILICVSGTFIHYTALNANDAPVLMTNPASSYVLRIVEVGYILSKCLYKWAFSQNMFHWLVFLTRD